jgi:hypothetical protein
MMQSMGLHHILCAFELLGYELRTKMNANTLKTILLL